MKSVAVFLADGFEEIEALTAVDLLRRAQIYVDTVSVTEDYMVTGSHGITVQTEDLFGEVDFDGIDMLFLPGGMKGVANLKDCSKLRRKISEFLEAGKKVAAICAAPTILGEMGLLKGKRVTCHPVVEQEITAAGAVLTRLPATVDGNIITGQAAGSAQTFALKLIEVLNGKEKAEEIAENIVY